MNDVEDLIAVEKIKVLKARYWRGVDMKDWDLLETVFTADFVGDFRGSATDPVTGFNPVPEATENILHGRKETIAMFKKAGANFISCHQGHNPEIEITGDTTAKAIWAIFDTLRFPEGPIAEINGYGHYHETYEKVSGEWMIKTSKLTRLIVDCISR